MAIVTNIDFSNMKIEAHWAIAQHICIIEYMFALHRRNLRKRINKLIKKELFVKPLPVSRC